MIPDADFVDLAYTLAGGRLPGDHSAALWRALARALPWLEAEERAAVLPIRAASVSDGSLAVNRRSRLLMRLPAPRVRAALALCGTSLAIDDAQVEVGNAMTRALIAHGTLYAHRVACPVADEAAFVRDVAEGLGALAVGGDFICGRRTAVRGPDGELAGYSLMLTGLRPAESLRLQVAGLGPHRKLGFGVFVPHRSTAAVGSDRAAEEQRAFR
ncbi:MAG: type I-MYXAN CRISPR-associated protein Cas6/Cmx6 [Burkholderiales bacterium]|nr:type I-MYXAN CRISPR-associated protein Cas6/Cmx6 [Burkholderiales bacterium]